MYFIVPSPKGTEPGHEMIFRDNDGAWIPQADGNRDFEQYKLWMEQGNDAEIYDEQNPPQITGEPVVDIGPNV
jgi:hypothetical protein